MITIYLSRQHQDELKLSLKKSGDVETGGILMAEHIGVNQFLISEFTINKSGTVATFIRKIEDAIGSLKVFFKSNEHNYKRFNYIGEWHSHPQYSPIPSVRDDLSMFEIIYDKSVGANFIVLMILKLDSSGELIGTVHTYLPDGHRYKSNLRFCNDQAVHEEPKWSDSDPFD